MKKIAMGILFALLLAVFAGACADSIKLGSTGDNVTKLQKNLAALGFYSGSITGHAGEKTVQAIKDFQKKYGLTQDGIAGSATLGKISAVLNPGQEPAKKDNADDVRQAQTALKALGMYSGQITGNIGSKTKAAIKAFQKKYGLTADGALTAETLAKIKVVSSNSQKPEEEPEKENSEAGKTETAAPSASLKYGSTGSSVTQLQKDLKQLGQYTGSVTGHYGSLTQAAVRRFQKANGLTADGVAGSKTLAAVKEAIKRQQSGQQEAEQGHAGAVLDLHWFDQKSFYTSHGVKKGLTVTIMDVATGKMFNARVQSTGNHADMEPKTAADTKIMCDMYGVAEASKISYKRRAVLVKARVDGVLYTYAGSMYGEVHGSQTITDNNYDGQFCIHFRHSTTSGTQVESSDNQGPIDKAVSYAVNSLGMKHVTDPNQL